MKKSANSAHLQFWRHYVHLVCALLDTPQLSADRAHEIIAAIHNVLVELLDEEGTPAPSLQWFIEAWIAKTCTGDEAAAERKKSVTLKLRASIDRLAAPSTVLRLHAATLLRALVEDRIDSVVEIVEAINHRCPQSVPYRITHFFA